MSKNRRQFMRNILGGGAALGTASMLSSFRPSVMDATAPPPQGAQPQVDIEKLEITSINYVRMKFPGTTPVMWNSIITCHSSRAALHCPTM